MINEKCVNCGKIIPKKLKSWVLCYKTPRGGGIYNSKNLFIMRWLKWSDKKTDYYPRYYQTTKKNVYIR